jgi:hypothetical protein
MNPVLAVSPLLVMLTIYAGFLMLAARLCRRSRIAPKHAFAFAGIIGLLAIGGRALFLHLGVVNALRLPVPFMLGAALHMTLGGWYFGPRATTADGRAAGWRATMPILGLTLGLYLALIAGLALVLWVLSGSPFVPLPR